MRNWRSATGVVSSVLLTALSLAFAASYPGVVLCIGISLFTGIVLLVRAFAKKGTQRLMALAACAVYLFLSILVLTHYSLVRDHVRWLLLAGRYKASVLAQPIPTNGGLKHVEWDGWGLIGGIDDTTVFLVFDPADSLSQALGMQPPVNARGLPCQVYRVHRLEGQWYAVEFYALTYWGQGDCR